MFLLFLLLEEVQGVTHVARETSNRKTLVCPSVDVRTKRSLSGAERNPKGFLDTGLGFPSLSDEKFCG